MRTLHVTATLVFLLSCVVRGEEPSGIQLLTDPTFTRGFLVIAPRNPKLVEDRLQRDASLGDPAWKLVQWTSRATIAGVAPERTDDGSLRYANDAKVVTLGPEAGDARGIRMLMRGDYEYEGRLRAQHEPWPHLLIEQRIDRSPSLAELSALQFRIACRLRLSEVKSSQPLQPWHCGQFQAFVTVQNTNADSPGQGDFLWFGIPVYDSRYRQPVAHAARDTAGSNKYIYTPAGSVYSDQAAADGQWLVIDHDLLPLIQEGLARAWREGYLVNSRNPAEMRITSINLGWELTGPLDVEMHVRDLSLQAIPK